MKASFPWNRVKLARVCSVFATSVRLRAERSFGYSGNVIVTSNNGAKVSIRTAICSLRCLLGVVDSVHDYPENNCN